MNRSFFAWVWMLGALGACGNEADEDAPAKCRALANEVCSALVTCGLATSQEKPECVSDVAADMGCEAAVQIGASYPECVRDVRATECSDWSTDLPSSCFDVILVPE